MNVQPSNGQPRILGSYQLLHRLAQGPEGEIWLAHKSLSQRQMIIRLLPPVPASAQAYLRQFNQVMRSLATLQHIHILPVYDFGALATSRDEISCYLVLPLIEGSTTLQERLQAASTPLSPDTCLHYLRQAAQALDFAHSRQVLHLGLTPATILFNGDLLMLTNFGLAPLLNNQQTHSGAPLQANPYLAPEQVIQSDQLAPTTPVTAACDVYSLAMISYRLFTGHLPPQGEANTRQNPANLPANSSRSPLPPIVENIHIKALSSKPGERYSSCSIFVQALERAWQGLPLAPAHDPDKTLVAPWTRQRLEQVLASMPTYIKPAEASPMVENPMDISVKPATPDQVANSMTPLYPPQLTSPNELDNFSTPTYRNPITPGPLDSAMTPTYRNPAAPNSMDSDITPTYRNPASPEKIAPTPSFPELRVGRRTLVIGGVAAAILAGGGAALAITSTWKGHFSQPSLPAVSPVHFTPGHAIASLTGHTAAVTNVVWSPDGRYLASASLDTFAMLWDLAAILREPSPNIHALNQPAREWNIYPYGLSTDQLHWSPDGHSLVTITSSCPTTLNPFSNTSKPRVYVDPAIKKDLLNYTCPIISPHSTTLAAIDGAGHRDHRITLWHFNTLAAPYASLRYTDANQFIGDNSSMNTIAWSPDGSQLAGITTLNEVVVWNVNSRTPHAVIKLPDRVNDEVDAQVIRVTLSWSPANPDLLAVANIDTIAIVDIQQKKVLQQLYTDDKEALNSAKDPQNPSLVFPNVVGITWSPDGRYIAASYARSPRVFVWDLQATHAKTTHELTIQSAFFPQNSPSGHTITINDLSWSPDGRYLATGSDDHSITIWQVGAAPTT